MMRVPGSTWELEITLSHWLISICEGAGWHENCTRYGNENWCHFDLATYVTHEFSPVRTYAALSRRQFFHQHGPGMSHEGNCRCDLSPRHVLTTVMPADCGRHRESFDLQNERLGTIWCLYGQRSPCLFPAR